MDHAGKPGVYAVKRYALDDLGRIDPGDRLADDGERVRRFQAHRGKLGRKNRRGLLRQRGIRCTATTQLVENRAGLGRQGGGVDTPKPGCPGQQHLARRGARLAHRQPVHRGSRAAPRDLHAVELVVGVSLLNMDLAPRNVEFLGDQHGQHDLHALADLGILGADRHYVIRGDADEGVERDRLAGPGNGLREHQIGVESQYRTARKRGSEERATGHHGGVAHWCTSAASRPAALWIALRMRRYVAQRQTLPLIPAAMSSGPGLGVRVSSAVADIICPAWQ